VKRKNYPTYPTVLLEVIRTLPNKNQTIGEIETIASDLLTRKCKEIDKFNSNYEQLESFLVRFFAQLGDEETIRKAIRYNTLAIAHFARKTLEETESDDYFRLDRIMYDTRQQNRREKPTKNREKTP